MSFSKIDRVHFHTFDSLRFLSFLLVFLHHSPVPKENFLHLFSKAGGIGVSFFFVLSGFLITYILILEKLNNNNRVPLKKFFKRRILRIWPLYYVMVLFAFCTPFLIRFLHLPSSETGYEPNWFFTLTFLENYMMMYKNDFPNVSPLIVIWSLCIEEHFYIIWGLIFYFISLKNIPILIIVSIFTSIVFRIIYGIYDIAASDIFTNIDMFAFGAIPAYLFVFHQEFIKTFEKIPYALKYLFAVFVLFVIVLDSNFSVLSDFKLDSLVFGILFSLLIVSTLGSRNVFKISDKSVLSWLGKFTYGLYLFHTICINLFNKVGNSYDLKWHTVMALSFISTVFLSYLSYHLFEKQFLKLKK